MLSSTGPLLPHFLHQRPDFKHLLEATEVQAFIDTDKYHQRKKVRFRSQDNLDIANNEAFLIPDPVVFDRYEQEYQRISAIFYQPPPGLREIIERIAQEIDRL